MGERFARAESARGSTAGRSRPAVGEAAGRSTRRARRAREGLGSPVAPYGKPAIYFEQGVVADSIPGTVGFLRNLGYEVAICDFFRFVNLNSRMWEYGNYVTSECEALRTKLIAFDDPELIECRPLHTNMVAIHPSGTRPNLGFEKPVRLRDGVLLATFSSLASSRPPKKVSQTMQKSSSKSSCRTRCSKYCGVFVTVCSNPGKACA